MNTVTDFQDRRGIKSTSTLEKIRIAKKTRNFYKAENYMSDPSIVKKRANIANFNQDFDSAL